MPLLRTAELDVSRYAEPFDSVMGEVYAWTEIHLTINPAAGRASFRVFAEYLFEVINSFQIRYQVA